MPNPTLQNARDLLKSAFGYEAFRPGQEAAVSAILSGRDTVVVLPTGGGKSLCFQVPALLMPGLTVVVSPLISLMKDQVDALTARGLPAAFINSTLSSGQVSDRLARVERGEIKLLYVAPERFDYGKTAERLRKVGVSLLAIDEAHCISQWGHDFRPSYLRVKKVHEELGSPTTIALTATATPEVRRDISRELALRDPETIITGFDRPNLHYFVIPVKNDAEKEKRLVEILKKHEGLAVIYASTRKAVDHLTTVLERARIPAAGYHAGLDDARRHEVQNAFMSERIRAIVATNAFGMGIDKPNVRLVIHYAMPGTLEAYYQEAGRAGRDGQHSDVFLLHAFPDRFTHEFFIKGSYPERAAVEQIYEALKKLSDKQGFVGAPPEDLIRLVKAKVNTREIEGALRILERSGAVASSNGEQARVHVRLLATPERIKREISGEANAELGLLRALWRGVGSALRTGAVVDLDGLPPGLGGAVASIPLLDSLEERQFLAWERIGSGTLSGRQSCTALQIPHRLGGNRPTARRRYVEAPGSSEVRVHKGVPARLRAPLFWRSCRARTMRWLRQLSRDRRGCERGRRFTAPTPRAKSISRRISTARRRYRRRRVRAHGRAGAHGAQDGANPDRPRGTSAARILYSPIVLSRSWRCGGPGRSAPYRMFAE